MYICIHINFNTVYLRIRKQVTFRLVMITNTYQ